MDADDRIHRLLEEIRDAQREYLAEYRSVPHESLELQRRAVTRQDQVGPLLYLLARWSHHLFR